MQAKKDYGKPMRQMQSRLRAVDGQQHNRKERRMSDVKDLAHLPLFGRTGNLLVYCILILSDTVATSGQ